MFMQRTLRTQRKQSTQRTMYLFLGSAMIMMMSMSFEAMASLIDRFIFFPNQQVFSKCPEASILGAKVIETKMVNTESNDSIRLYLKETEGAKSWLLYFHGNAGSACDRLPFIRAFNNEKMNVAIVEYPGYSNDPQRPTEKRLLKNAVDVYDYLQTLNPYKVPFTIYGESLGTAVSTYLASQREVNKLVLHAPFPSILEVARVHFPILPLRRLMGVRFKSSDWAPEVKASVLVLHGKRDKTIPLWLGQKQARNFTKAKSVQVNVIEGADHNDVMGFSEYWDSLKPFLFSEM